MVAVPASGPLVTVPRACRPPATPGRLGVFASSGHLGAVWDLSPEGDAPDGYDVALAGAWTGQVALGPSRVQEADVTAGHLRPPGPGPERLRRQPLDRRADRGRPVNRPRACHTAFDRPSVYAIATAEVSR